MPRKPTSSPTTRSKTVMKGGRRKSARNPTKRVSRICLQTFQKVGNVERRNISKISELKSAWTFQYIGNVMCLNI